MSLPTPAVVAALTDLADEPRAREAADAVEFRLDLADDPDPLAALRDYDGKLPVLATNRVAAEGGAAPDAPGRLETLAAAARLEHVVAVDVEAAWLADGRAAAVRTAAGADTTVVASVHDFEGTPELSTLRTRLADACGVGDVGKLAVTARDHDDALRVLRALRWADREGLRAAAMAMGEAGRHTRVLGPLYGSALTYAPVRTDAATAPGQYDLATLRSLLDRL